MFFIALCMTQFNWEKRKGKDYLMIKESSYGPGFFCSNLFFSLQFCRHWLWRRSLAESGKMGPTCGASDKPNQGLWSMLWQMYLPHLRTMIMRIKNFNQTSVAAILWLWYPFIEVLSLICKTERAWQDLMMGRTNRAYICADIFITFRQIVDFSISSACTRKVFIYPFLQLTTSYSNFFAFVLPPFLWPWSPSGRNESSVVRSTYDILVSCALAFCPCHYYYYCCYY